MQTNTVAAERGQFFRKFPPEVLRLANILLHGNREMFADLCLSLIASIFIFILLRERETFFFLNLVIQKIKFSVLINNFEQTPLSQNLLGAFWHKLGLGICRYIRDVFSEYVLKSLC